MPIIHQIHGFTESNVTAPQDTGWVNFASITTIVGGGIAPWFSVSNALTQNSSGALACEIDDRLTHYLVGQDPLWPTIPGGAIINGIQVRYLPLGGPGDAFEWSVRLVVGGSLTGADRRVIQQHPACYCFFISRGGSSDLWATALTPAILNSSNFGWGLQVFLKDVGFFTCDQIDVMQIRAFYTA